MTRSNGERARDLAVAAGFRARPGASYTDHLDGTNWTGYEHPDGRGLNLHFRPDGRFVRARSYGIGWTQGRSTARTLPELVRLFDPARVGLLGLVRHQFGERAAQLGYSYTDDLGVTLWDVRDREGRVIWDSNHPDVKPWPFLGDVADLLASRVRVRTRRGDGLLFDLTVHERR